MKYQHIVNGEFIPTPPPRSAAQAFAELAMDGWLVQENTPERTTFHAVENPSVVLSFTTPRFLWAVAHGLDDVRALIQSEHARVTAAIA